MHDQGNQSKPKAPWITPAASEPAPDPPPTPEAATEPALEPEPEQSPQKRLFILSNEYETPADAAQALIAALRAAGVPVKDD